MGWAAVRDALQAAIVSTSGFAAGKVLWGYQDADEPSLDYVLLELSGLAGVGQDGLQYSTDLTRPAGQEVKVAIIGVREVTLSIKVYSAATVSSNTSADAMETAEKIRTGLQLPSVMAALQVQNVSTFDLQNAAQYIPAVVAAGFRGFALLDVRCYLPAPAVFEYTGYIRKATTTLTATGAGLGTRTVPFTAGS